MECFKIAGTNNTPNVSLDTNGILIIQGNSTMSNPEDFYSDIKTWLTEFNPDKDTNITLVLDMGSMNLKSPKEILEITNLLKKYKDKGCSTIVEWYYEDENGFESGNDFKDMVDIPFILVKGN